MKLLFVALLAVSTLAFAQHHSHDAPFGRTADAKKAGRVVRVDMTDQMRFQPDRIALKVGETVRFEPVNKGKVDHEMVIGTMDELKKHAEVMKKKPDMKGHAHSGSNMAYVAPGKSGVIGWQFTQPGEFFYACLIPGHFDAGMIGKVTVSR